MTNVGRMLALTDGYLEGNTVDHFRDAVVQAFRAAGNQVEVVVANNYLRPGSAEFLTREHRDRFVAEVGRARWDAVFNFNRAGMVEGLPFVADDTPVLTWFVDSPWRTPASLRKHKPSEHVFIADRPYMERLAAEPGLSPSTVHYLPFATMPMFTEDVTPVPNGPDYAADLSFVGTFFSMRPLLNAFSGLDHDNACRLVDLIREHQANYHVPIAELVQKYDLDLTRSTGVGKSSEWAEFLLRAIDDYLSAVVRADLLSKVADQDVKIYGDKEWLMAATRDLGLLTKFQFRQAGPRELPFIYRASKVLLNICHFQARTGLPYRVYDILGSNGFLLSEHRDDLARLFEVGTELETFTSASELRDKTLYFLEHEDERLGIAERGRARILKEHMVAHRVEAMLAQVGSGGGS